MNIAGYMIDIACLRSRLQNSPQSRQKTFAGMR
jgi:hypothetical protein